jgi:hypothetical protein
MAPKRSNQTNPKWDILEEIEGRSLKLIAQGEKRTSVGRIRSSQSIC